MKSRRLVIICCCLLAFTAHGDEQEQRSRLDLLKKQIATLKDSLFNRTSEIDLLETQLEEREIAAGQIRARSQQLDSQISNLETELQGMEQRQIELEQHSKDQRAMIAREMDAAYRLGNSEPLKVLLNQEDPYKFARILKYYQYFADARQENIHQLQKTIAELEVLSLNIAGNQEQLVSAREENAVKLAELTLEMEKRQLVITDLNRALKDDTTRLAKLNKERSDLEALIASLEEDFQNLAPPTAEPFAELKGKLPWPTNGKISQSFGSQRGQGLKWAGWLIDTEAGEAVITVHNGRVVFSDYFRGHGLMIIVDHGNGFLSLYAHNQLLLKEIGDWVQSGDTIAQSGATGGLATSALYFEIRHNGKPQDPKRWLKSQG